MEPLENLRIKLKNLNGRDYGAYQSLKGSYKHLFFELYVDQIPKDPYAPPFTGIYRIRLNHSFCYIPSGLIENRTRKIAYCDFLARRFFNESYKCSKHRGTGNSGLITVAEPGQIIIERTSVIFNSDYIELRFFIGLPADGRAIMGNLAESMIFNELPRIIEKAFKKENIHHDDCLNHLKCAETSVFLRSQLKKYKIVSFIGERSIIPRESGTSEKPLDSPKVIEFISPQSLKCTIKLPEGEIIEGMGIPEGITLIVGGGYHGKSTLLNAIANGIYNHIPGDGRELIVSNDKTLKIRSYNGRYVEKVNISSFINNLPSDTDTSVFSTENASGSTSQATGIIEGIEMGVEALLMDEDTCATNFMIRDEKMQKLVDVKDEPITPFIDRAREIYGNKGISTILVAGGSGDYFDVSDTVIQMKSYRPYDVTEKALEIANNSKDKREKRHNIYNFELSERIPVPGSIDPFNQYKKKSVYAKEINRINFGKYIIDLTDVEQIHELSQTKGIMEALLLIDNLIDGKTSLKNILNQIELKLKNEGMDYLSERINGNLAEFRMMELACALNRLRSLKIK